MVKRLFYSLTFLTLFIPFISEAQSQTRNVQIPELSDSVQVSLLSNYPWQGAVYAVFGHTSLRFNDLKNQRDILFNYGLFNMGSDNFIYKFASGQTDYVVGAVPFEYAIQEYHANNIIVFEQVLNLDNAEKQKLWEDLIINCQPENRTYRYNFFFDNCATRVRDIIEKDADGDIVYSPTNKKQTFRELLYEHTQVQPWLAFGINLVIGSDGDKEATDRQKMFLPMYMMNAYDGAKIIGTDNAERDLVISKQILINGDKLTLDAPDKAANYPLIVGILLLISTIFLCIYSIKRKKRFLRKIFSFILFFVSGAGGCVIFFLMYFSVHPSMNPNWNLVWLNPLQLIFTIFFFFKFTSRVIYYYHFINFAGLSLFVLAWFLIPQHLEVSFLPYILSILVCSGAWVCQYKMDLKEKSKQKINR